MYVVTGGAGFIGSNIVKALRDQGKDVIIVDNMTEAKVRNIASLGVVGIISPQTFLSRLDELGEIKGVFHQGACADTTRGLTDPNYVVEANIHFTQELVGACSLNKVPLVYASSAAVYGNGGQRYHFIEDPCNENPMNLYGMSKLVIDNAVRCAFKESDSTIVGLRYFNVYGPGEEHKGKMASVAYQMLKAKKFGKKFKLFEHSENLKRDFVHVSDVVNVNLYFMFGEKRTGIYNVGTGKARSFRDLANVCEIDFGIKSIPEEIRHTYQMFTEADLSKLREAGYTMPFLSLEDGINLSRQEWRYFRETAEEDKG